MACGTPFDAFRVATEYLSKEIYTRGKFRSVLQNLIPEGVFPKNSGTQASVFTVEPNDPTAENTGGTQVENSDSTTTATVSPACTYSFTDINIGFTETTYKPRRLQYRGPLFCKDTKYFEHAPDEFANKYLDTLSQYVELDYDSFLFYHYARLVPIYVARTGGFNSLGTASTTLTAAAATSELTQSMLDALVPLLIYNRSVPSTSDGNGWIDLGPNGPLWTLQLGVDVASRLKTDNADLRTDLRYANPQQLLARLGATEAIKNFRHQVIPLPWRFTHNGTSYVSVPKYASSAATKGYKTPVNPNYINPLTAPYEAALILSPDVMVREHVAPDSSVGPLNWEPSNYMGEWTWKTGPEAVQAASGDACYDPLHKFGRHFGEIIDAPRPGPNPGSGAIIFFRRCQNAVTLSACT